MPDAGAAYTLETPDGRVVFGDPDHPDFVGYLDGDNGITHSVGHELPGEVIPDAEGMRQGRGTQQGMSVTLQGRLWPDPPELLWEKEARVRRATRALDRDGLLRYTPPDGIERIVRFRRPEDPSFTGRRARQTQIVLSAEQPYAEASNLSTLELFPADVYAGGVAEPVIDPVSAGASGLLAATNADNQGNRDAWPAFRFDGPCERPGAKNLDTGKVLRVLRNLADGEWITVDTHPGRRSIRLNDNASIYGEFDFDEAEWWALGRGVTGVQFVAFSSGAAAKMTVMWRHTYEGLT